MAHRKGLVIDFALERVEFHHGDGTFETLDAVTLVQAVPDGDGGVSVTLHLNVKLDGMITGVDRKWGR